MAQRFGPHRYEYTLGKRQKSFSASVDEWARVTNARLIATFQTALQMVIDDAQLSDDKGGRMRVDTGFLRASGQVSLTGIPAGPSERPETGSFTWNDGPVMVSIQGMALGDSLWFGWTANYAKYREAHDAFLDLALQRWQEFVDRAVAEGKKQVS